MAAPLLFLILLMLWRAWRGKVDDACGLERKSTLKTPQHICAGYPSIVSVYVDSKKLSSDSERDSSEQTQSKQGKSVKHET